MANLTFVSARLLNFPQDTFIVTLWRQSMNHFFHVYTFQFLSLHKSKIWKEIEEDDGMMCALHMYRNTP
jgi:hypothetical protein